MGGHLLQRWHQRKFGSRLLLKLATIFALVGVLPGALIYAVSYQFVSRSIESWFDVKVEGALTAGVNLASVTLDAMANDMANNSPQCQHPAGRGVRWPERGWCWSASATSSGPSMWCCGTAPAWPWPQRGESLLDLSPERPSAQVLRSLRA